MTDQYHRFPRNVAVDIVGMREALRAVQSSVNIEAIRTINQAGEMVSKALVDIVINQPDLRVLSDAVNSIALYEKTLLESSKIAHIGRLQKDLVAEVVSLTAGLNARVEQQLRTDWILPKFPYASIIGFERLLDFSGVVNTTDPFATDVSEIVAEEIGPGITSDPSTDLIDPIDRDAAAVESGLKAELIAFPTSEYSGVLYAAELKVSIPSTNALKPDWIQDPRNVPNSEHYQLFSWVENQLRNFITRQLRSLAGGSWIRQRVSDSMRAKWRRRQDEDCNRYGVAQDPIYYADFPDLMEIICRANNWRDTFEATFKNRDDVKASFQRLFPVRNAIAHNRALGRSDELTLICESTRILCALGVMKLD